MSDALLDYEPPIDRQEHHYEHDVDGQWEGVRPHGAPRFHGWVLYSKLRHALDLLPFGIDGLSVLNVCAGSGMDAEYLARAGADVLLLDISDSALGRARARFYRAGLGFFAIRASVESLPFADRSIDVVFAHDGLHHLADPLAAIDEMARVARRAVVILEPAVSAATETAIRFGLALEVEEAGNRVRRFRPEELADRLAKCGFSHVASRRRLVRQHHWPTRLERMLSFRIAFQGSRLAYAAVAVLLSRVGNKLTVVAWR